MHRSLVPVEGTCKADWNAMTGDDLQRFCDHCEKDVHNLSNMTPDEVRSLLARPEASCVRYFADSRGMLYLSTPQLRRQRRGAQRLLAIAAAFPLLLTACADSSDVPSAVAQPAITAVAAPTPGSARPELIEQDLPTELEANPTIISLVSDRASLVRDSIGDFFGGIKGLFDEPAQSIELRVVPDVLRDQAAARPAPTPTPADIPTTEPAAEPPAPAGASHSTSIAP